MGKKVDKELLRSEYEKDWSGNERMVDYCVNKVAAMAVLPCGDVVTVDKQGIETSFCFGESGYDADDASRMAYHAKTNEEYFKRENMRRFESEVRALEGVLASDDLVDRESGYLWEMAVVSANERAEGCHLKELCWERVTDVIDACGGSCRLVEVPGRVLEIRGVKRRVLTREEIGLILEAVKSAAAAHEKKVDSYLKRYGLSKVRSWTYWRDA